MSWLDLESDVAEMFSRLDGVFEKDKETGRLPAGYQIWAPAEEGERSRLAQQERRKRPEAKAAFREWRRANKAAMSPEQLAEHHAKQRALYAANKESINESARRRYHAKKATP